MCSREKEIGYITKGSVKERRAWQSVLHVVKVREQTRGAGDLCGSAIFD